MTNILKTSKDFTDEERARLLEQFEASGLEAVEFAKEHNLAFATLRNWIWLMKNPNVKRVRHSPVERKKTVEAFLASDMGRQEFATAWGISYTTLSEWLNRYESEGSDGLMDRPLKPGDRRLGMKVPMAVRAEVIAAKRDQPGWGLKSIKNWLYRSRGMKVSTGSIRKTVTAEGFALATKPKKKRKSSDKPRRFERARPMQLWQSDITQYRLGPSGMRVYLTVFMDDHSRYIVGWRLLSRQTSDLVIDAFKDAMVRFGRPEEVLTDQGRQYFAWRGKSDLEKLLEKERIKHVVSRAHHPQTLGKCERFWETVRLEFWDRVHPKDLEEARERLKYYVDHYNHQRPHQGIDGATPADRFFGVAEEVREIIEKTVQENSLRLALGELPKPPAFLIGQVGDQKIAFHGTSGGFYLTHEKLGEKSDGEFRSDSVAEFAIKRDAGVEQAPAPEEGQSMALCADAPLPGDPGSGSLGQGERVGASESAGDGDDDHGGMGGPVDEGSSLGEAGDEAAQILANESSGDGRDDGGSADTAEAEAESRGYRDDGTGRAQDVAQEGERP